MGSLLVISMVKYHKYGNMLLTIKVPRNPVLDYMTQASIVARSYLCAGWHMTNTTIE